MRKSLIFGCCLLLLGCYSDQGSETKPSKAVDAWLDIKPSQYPKAYEKLGAIRFQEINSKAPQALELMASQSACNGVELAGISEQATKKELVWYGHCYNGEKIVIHEKYLKEKNVKN